MNHDNYFAFVRFNHGKVVSLGKAPLAIIMRERLPKVLAQENESIECAQLTFGTDKDTVKKIAEYSPDSIRYAGLTPEQIQEKKWLDGLKAEGLIQQLDPDARTILPDVCTDGEYNNAICSPECSAYEHYAIFPENRIGADSSIIEAAKLAWFNACPLIAPHYPKWRE